MRLKKEYKAVQTTRNAQEQARQQAIDEIVEQLDKAFEDVTSSKMPPQRHQGLKTAIGKLIEQN